MADWSFYLLVKVCATSSTGSTNKLINFGKTSQAVAFCDHFTRVPVSQHRLPDLEVNSFVI